MKIIQVTVPELTMDKYIGKDVALRPQRRGGPRYDIEKYKNKTIFHNYGHGGYGITILYGMVNKVLQNFYKQDIKDKQVAVLGSGYYGLLTGLLLQQKGYKVTIYSSNFPIKPLDFKTPKITSQVAGGIFFPYLDNDQFLPHGKEFSRQTWDFYKERIQNGKNKGLYDAPMYFVNMNPIEHYSQGVPQGILEYEKVKIQFNNNSRIFDGYKTDSIAMDGDTFLNELFQECKKAGVQFQQTSFESKEDLDKIQENVVFNCLGLVSMKVFKDENLELRKGHLIYFDKSLKIPYYLKYMFQNKEEITFYPQFHKIAVGLTKIAEDIKDFKYEQKYWDILHQRLQRFKDEIRILPKL